MDNKLIGNENNIIFYTDEEGNANIEVILQDEDVWLNAQAIAELFEITDKVIYKHIKNIYEQEELKENSTVAKIATMGKNGQTYQVKYYNLDMIISIGYRVNSKKAVKFRQWANKIIKEYIIQGFSLNEERFLKGRKSDQEYFKRLLEKIKLIRTSERMFYQKITDIFAECSLDYDKTSDLAREFYATIQNKFHFAITSNTAAEIIYNRVDSKKENMGLTTWKEAPEGKILKSDVTIAKNYLSETELKNLNNVVNIFLDIAEDNAERNIPMYMKDWKKEVDTVLSIRHYDILEGKGKISKKEADEKAEKEYEKYKVIQDKKFLSDFDILLLEAENINKSKNDKV
ncbi:MAG: cell filamentation protein Fic [Clostridia bacterium]|nr:cell filamentation protein Fic [Clostridia bacterium]